MTNRNRVKAARRKEQPFRELRQNLARDGMERVRPGEAAPAGYGEAPPGYPSNAEMLDFIRKSRTESQREMFAAVDKANARLEPKQTRIPDPPYKPQPRVSYRQAEPAAVQSINIEITEVELLGAMSDAQAANRTDLTPDSLARLLALPHSLYRRPHGA